MKITMLPVNYSTLPEFSVEISGEILVLNGDTYDFTPLPDGGSLPALAVGNEFIIGEIQRVNGELEVLMILPVPEESLHLLMRREYVYEGMADGPLELPQ